MRKNTRKIEATTKLRIQKLNDRKEVHNIKLFIKFKTNSITIQSELPSNIVQISNFIYEFKIIQIAQRIKN